MPVLHSIADSHHFVAADPDPACHFDPDPGPACHFATDPDPTFHFDADPDPDPTLQIKVQSAQIVSLSYSLYFGFHQKIDADLDPDYKLIRIRLINLFWIRLQIHPTFQFDADPCGSGSATLA